MENKVVDSLSRQPSGITPTSFVLQSSITHKWMTSISQSYEEDDKAIELIKQLLVDTSAQPGFQFKNGLLYHQDKLYVNTATRLRYQLLELYHGSPMSGHSGINGTYIMLKKHFFYWSSMLTDVVKWIKGCDTYARCKHENVANSGMLQPLPKPGSTSQ